MANRNLDLAENVNQLLDLEREAGPSITSTLGASVYWFFNRLDAHERDLARLEYAEWVDTGKVPPSDLASDLEKALRTARERGSQRLSRKTQGGR